MIQIDAQYWTLLLFGLCNGTVFSEVAWRAVSAFVRVHYSQVPPVRLMIGLVAISASAALIPILAQTDQLAEIPVAVWIDALSACLAAEIWLGFMIFAQTMSGVVSVAMRSGAAVVNLAIAIVTLILMVGLATDASPASFLDAALIAFGAFSVLLIVRRLRIGVIVRAPVEEGPRRH